jgi:hypothetical protein
MKDGLSNIWESSDIERLRVWERESEGDDPNVRKRA